MSGLFLTAILPGTVTHAVSQIVPSPVSNYLLAFRPLGDTLSDRQVALRYISGGFVGVRELRSSHCPRHCESLKKIAAQQNGGTIV